MPGFDRTGPEGKGSLTGRKMGKCNPVKPDTDDTLEQDNLLGRNRSGRGRKQAGGQRKDLGRGEGRGLGRGQGRGRGRD